MSNDSRVSKVKLKIRKGDDYKYLRATYTKELALDLMSIQGLDAASELKRILYDELCHELLLEYYKENYPDVKYVDTLFDPDNVEDMSEIQKQSMHMYNFLKFLAESKYIEIEEELVEISDENGN